MLNSADSSSGSPPPCGLVTVAQSRPSKLDQPPPGIHESAKVGPPHRPNPSAGCVRWGKQPGYVVFAGQKVPLERPRVRTREGQEVELQSYSQLQQDGKLQRAVQERMVSGLSTRNYRRAVESVLEG
jgi:hypothetical protein